MIFKNLIVLLILFNLLSVAQAISQNSDCIIFHPTKIFDGQNFITNKSVMIKEDLIYKISSREDLENQTCQEIELDGFTLMPGMIEGHAHLLLHPYNETSWNDQVLLESHAERAIRGAQHAKKTLEAGFTTVRDLGSEGADYVDVGVKQSIEKGIIPGPRMFVAGKAIVTTGSYGPKGFQEYVDVPLGAEPADGYDDLIRVTRDQIGKGADIIKVYADYRWGPNGEARPTFTLDELKLIVEVAESSGRYVAAHASSAEAMRRATLAGVRTIEHGDEGTSEIFELMKKHQVALCPTLAAGDAILQYRGWNKGIEEEPDRIKQKRKSFTAALEAGVEIVAGGDVGVFPHGDNVRELEMMVDYGMNKIDVLRSVTSSNARILGLSDQLGSVKEGLKADIVVLEGDLESDFSALRKLRLVMKNGKIFHEK